MSVLFPSAPGRPQPVYAFECFTPPKLAARAWRALSGMPGTRHHLARQVSLHEAASIYLGRAARSGVNDRVVVDAASRQAALGQVKYTLLNCACQGKIAFQGRRPASSRHAPIAFEVHRDLRPQPDTSGLVDAHGQTIFEDVLLPYGELNRAIGDRIKILKQLL